MEPEKYNIVIRPAIGEYAPKVCPWDLSVPGNPSNIIFVERGRTYTFHYESEGTTVNSDFLLFSKTVSYPSRDANAHARKGAITRLGTVSLGGHITIHIDDDLPKIVFIVSENFPIYVACVPMIRSAI